MNGDINTVVLMFEQLRVQYLLTDEAHMCWQWLEWLSMAECSGIPELVDFAIRKHNFTDQVVAHASHQVTSAAIEDMMNKIKVIMRAPPSASGISATSSGVSATHSSRTTSSNWPNKRY